jgi:hypothetical protein
MKKYFFGYLFVRIAKLLAVLMLLAGVGYGLFRLEQASLAAESASYQPSEALRQSLAGLDADAKASAQLVTAFCVDSGNQMAPLQTVQFPDRIRSNDDFARLGEALSQSDQQRQQLKETLVMRFDSLLEVIQTKLRAHAAEVAPAAPTPSSPGEAAQPAPQRAAAASAQDQTLYARQMSNYDIQQRASALDKGKEFLTVLKSAAEDPKNRQDLMDSISQLEALSHLLPSKVEMPVEDGPPQNSPSPSAPAPRRELNAEKIANQLAQLRGSVRQVMLTSWTLDEAYSQASALAAEEQARCRLASLTVKGIWLGAFGQLGASVVEAIFAAFLVLVMADFMQTLLDTATNTGITASVVDGSR